MNEFDRTKGTVDLAHVDKSHDGRVDLMRGVFCIVQTTAGGVTETRLVLQGLAGEAGNRKLVYRIDDARVPWEVGGLILGDCVQDSPGMAKADASARKDGWDSDADGPIISKEEREIEAAVKRIRLARATYAMTPRGDRVPVGFEPAPHEHWPGQRHCDWPGCPLHALL